MVETVQKLLRIHRELPEDWRAIKQMVDRAAAALPVKEPGRKRRHRPESGNPSLGKVD